MIILTLLVVLIFSIASVSSASIDNDNGMENKALKSNDLSIHLTANATLSTANKTNTAKENTAKATNATKTNKTTAKSTGSTNKTAAKSTISTNKTTAKSTGSTNKTTVNKKTLAKTSTSFMNSVERNGKFPNVRISNKNYSHTEYLYLMSKAIENESNSKVEIKANLVYPYKNAKIKSIKGSINKKEYVKVASKTRIFIEKNKRAPNWASYSKGNIPYNQLILLFSKCLDSYNKNNKLPNSVKLDDLDLDKIKSKIDKKTTKSSSNSTKKNTDKVSAAKKTNATTTKTTTNTNKKTNTTTNTTTNTSKKTNTTTNTTTNTSKKTNTTTKTTSTSTKNTSVNASNDNASLVEKSMNYVNSILNNILDRLDPSKFKIKITKTDQANAKFNTSKVNVDVSGKSSVNVKISAKDTKKNATKTTTAKKKTAQTTTKKTNTTKATTQKSSTTKATTQKSSTTKATTQKASTTKSAANSTKKITASSVKKTNSTNAKKATNKTASKKITIPESLKKYLASTKNCQVNSKQIKELAKNLTSSLKSDYDKGKKLFTWVRDNIQYEKYSNTRKGALKTLKKKQGNCVDQSHLLIALSRAAGIPARYVNGGNCKFTSGYVGGHVWAQMYLNKKWVVADTTSSRNSLGKIKNWNTKSYTLYGKYSSIEF